jgi:Holliday junction DNA helicase RuvA
MIYKIKGEVSIKKENFIVVDCSGIGYKIFTASKNISKLIIGEPSTFFCSFSIKTDGRVELYGFLSERELDFFDLLNTVSGVGPKSAMGILGGGEIDEIAAAINEGNPAMLTKVAGVGKKTAERVILELKGKVVMSEDISRGIVNRMEYDADLESVLLEMGYKKSDIKNALSKISPEIRKLEERLREALKILRNRS